MIYIKWVDSAAVSGWKFDVDLDFSPVIVESIGWVLHEDEDSITITGHKTDNGQSHSAMTIPKVSIIETVNLPSPS